MFPTSSGGYSFATPLADEAATDWWTARRRAYAKQSPSLGGPDAGAWRRSWALGAKSKSVARRRRRWPEI